MKYFIITESDDLVLAPDFARQLRAHWPQATVEPVSDPASSYALEFRIPRLHSHVDGSLNRAGSAIAFIGDLRDCAEFALGCRSIIPAPDTPHPPPERLSRFLRTAPWSRKKKGAAPLAGDSP